MEDAYMLEKLVLTIEQMNHLKELGLSVPKTAIVLIFSDYDGNVESWDNVISFGNHYLVYSNKTGKAEYVYKNYLDAENGAYDHSYREECGVLTFQELWKLLPKTIIDNDVRYDIQLEDSSIGYYSIYGGEIDSVLQSFKDENELNLLYKMLCWILEKNYFTNNEMVSSK